MKILIISNVYPPNFIGGYELAAMEVAEFLASRGFEIEVLTSDSLVGRNSNSSKIQVTRSLQCAALNPKTYKPILGSDYINPWNIRQLAIKIAQFQPDSIMLWNLQSLGAIGILKYIEALELPTFLYLMDNIFAGINPKSENYKNIHNQLGPLKIPSNVRVVSMSKRLINEIQEEVQLPILEYLIIPGWVRSVSKGLEVNTTRDGLGNFRFVFSSRVAAHKGINLVIDAAHKLVEQGMVKFSVDVYGQGEIQEMMMQIEAKGLQNYIFYRGTYDKTAALEVLREYDALLFPTWPREAFGFIAVEAVSAGCIPILTEGIGAGEWLQQGLECLKIPRDVDSLSNAMLLLMSTPENQFLAMRKQASEVGEKYFSFDYWMQIFLDEIEVHCSNQNFSKRIDPFQLERAFIYLLPNEDKELPHSVSVQTYSALFKFYGRLPSFLKVFLKRILLRF